MIRNKYTYNIQKLKRKLDHFNLNLLENQNLEKSQKQPNLNHDQEILTKLFV